MIATLSNHAHTELNDFSAYQNEILHVMSRKNLNVGVVIVYVCMCVFVCVCACMCVCACELACELACVH